MVLAKNISSNNPICPECGGETIPCKGGTCLVEIPGINWICMECLNEF
jgi:tRNA(Ile2) C34 agmatinyltransferase TiaS